MIDLLKQEVKFFYIHFIYFFKRLFIASSNIDAQNYHQEKLDKALQSFVKKNMVNNTTLILKFENSGEKTERINEFLLVAATHAYWKKEYFDRPFNEEGDDKLFYFSEINIDEQEVRIKAIHLLNGSHFLFRKIEEPHSTVLRSWLQSGVLSGIEINCCDGLI